jgi:D-alanine-D-alanine ligase
MPREAGDSVERWCLEAMRLVEQVRRSRKRLHIALVYNGDRGCVPDRPEDRGSTADLRLMIRRMARALRSIGYRVTVVPLARDLFAFQRKLRGLRPDVVFNQYDDVVHGALYEMRVPALVRMMGFPATGSSALAIGLTRYKYMTASLLQGAGIRIPPSTVLLERVGDVDGRKWQFPLIVQPSQEHAGMGLDRDSVVRSKRALRDKVRQILQDYKQPVLVQAFLPGREFNVGVVGGRRLRVMPLAEVDYSRLPPDIPPIMSYAAKWIDTSEEFEKTSVICPAAVDPELAREVVSTALRAFRAVGAWGYGRVDVRLDTEGRPCVLEVNCNACLEEGHGLARQADQAGISSPRLLQMIVRAALEGPPHDADVPMF